MHILIRRAQLDLIHSFKKCFHLVTFNNNKKKEHKVKLTLCKDHMK